MEYYGGSYVFFVLPYISWVLILYVFSVGFMGESNLRERVRFWFDDLETPMGKAVDIVVLILILASAITYVVLTYDLHPKVAEFLSAFEFFIGVIFSLEYILRVWSSKNRIKHVTNIYSIIDLIAIIPFFTPFPSLQFMRIFRMFRVFRLLRFLEHRFFFFGEITQTRLIETRILFTIFTIVFISAGLMLSMEGGVNPKINTFTDAMYFSIVTLSTVGYGDIVPITQAGRIITLLIISSGLIFIPWQLGKLAKIILLTHGKEEVTCGKCGLTKHDGDAIHCKHCGEIIYQKTEGTQ